MIKKLKEITPEILEEYVIRICIFCAMVIVFSLANKVLLMGD